MMSSLGVYKLCLFDFDGTLVDTVSDITHHVNLIFDKNGLAMVTVEQVKYAIGLGVHELFKNLNSTLSSNPELLDRMVEEFKKSYREKPVLYSKPYDGVCEVLEGALKNVQKAIITNKPQDITLQILDILDVKKYFPFVIGMHAGYPAKPDPTSIHHFMEKFGCSKSETVYIGDSRVDAQTSLAAGVDFVWMSYGYDKIENVNPTHQMHQALDWARLV